MLVSLLIFCDAGNAKISLQSAILPFLSGWVPVILKLLLATVSAGSNMQQNNPNNPMFNGSMSSREYFPRLVADDMLF